MKKSKVKHLKKKAQVFKRKRAPDPLNPFEIRTVTKERFSVLDGDKKNPGIRHAPGISRKRAIEIRKETLLPELKLRNKANVFLDRRIGERDKGLSHEDKMIARFSRERAKKFKKGSIFNLGEGEDLTHRGKLIGESADLMEDPRSDSDEDEGDVLGEAKFGGFLKKREETPGSKTWKERLEEMIAATREKRAAMQKQKDDAVTLTEKLDSQWKELSKVLQVGKKKEEEEEKERPKPDDYEILVREFKLSARVPATDRMKSTEELEMAEKQKLERLEQEKLKRMAPPLVHPAVEKKMKRSLASADALPEDYLVMDVMEATSSAKNHRLLWRSVDEAVSSLAESVPPISSKAMKKAAAIQSLDDPGAITSLLKSLPHPEHEPLIVDALMKQFNPGQMTEDKGQLMSLWTTLLQYLDDCATDVTSRTVRSMECLLPVVCKLGLSFPQYAGQCLQDVLIQKHPNILECKDYPGLDTLVFVQVTGGLFPVTDFRHAVTTPAVVLLSHALSLGTLDRPRSFFAAVYCLRLMLLYTREAERYSPESMTVIVNLLNSALPKEERLQDLFPFRLLPIGKHSLALNPDDDATKINPIKMCPSKVQLESKSFTLEEKTSLFCHLLELTSQYGSALKTLPSMPEIFIPIRRILSKLAKHSSRRSPEVVDLIKSVAEEIRSCVNQCEKPSSLLEAPKPKMLRLYEPRIDTEYTQGRNRLVAKRRKKTESQILQQRVREETRGAMKEIRKDNAFVAAQVYKEQRSKDAEEKEKLKRLMVSLQGQEAEFKTMQKQKAKLKKK